jgi:hypothetical protein
VSANIGAILVPDVEPFTQAFQRLGPHPVTIEIDLTLTPGGGHRRFLRLSGSATAPPGL